MKRYVYKIYDSNDVFISNVSGEITSQFKLVEEINTPNTEFRFTLGRSPESLATSNDIAFNNHVVVQVVDDDSDALVGKTVFKGKIVDFIPSYTESSDSIEIVCFGFGADLDNYLLDLGNTITQDYRDSNIVFGARNFNNFVLAQSIVFDDDSRIWSVTLRHASTDNSEVTVGIYTGLPVDYATGTLIAATSKVVSNTEFQDIVYYFSEPLNISAGTYHLRVEIIDHGSGTGNTIEVAAGLDPYSDGALYQCSDDVTDPSQTFSLIGPGILGAYDLWFKISSGTTQPFYSADPSDILRTALDYYQTAGGIVGYDGTTIEDTGAEVTYTFTDNTILEVVKKCLELAPPDWYWYIDQTTNMLHFHQKTTVVDHTLQLGKDITRLVPEYRSENVINLVYFFGKDGLTKKYTRQDSIDLYGLHAYRLVDQRVSQEETADILARTLLDTRQGPEIRLTVDIIDNADGLHGLDLESITVGDVVKFRSFGSTQGSLWDVSFWDVAYWDYNPLQIDTLQLQITKIDRGPDKATISMSTVPPDVNKRIEDINRRVTTMETLNNAAAAT